MIVELFFLTLFSNDFIIVHSAEFSAPLHFTEEPSDIQFSSKTSGYLHCVAGTTSSYASKNQITITWRFGNGSLVKNISDIVQVLPNGTLWFKPFTRLLPAVHYAKYQCVANLTLHNQAIMSRSALVHAVIVKPFQVKVEDQDVFGPGGTATFTCIYPQEVSSYVRIRKWFADKEPQEAGPSGNLVIPDVQESHSKKLYYCVIVNILTKETLASNVAKISIRNALDAWNFPLKFKIVPVNNTVVHDEMVMFECLASRTRNVEYVWKHNNIEIKINHPYSLVNGRSLRIMKTVLKDDGKYTCVARDKTNGEEISATSYLHIQVRLVFRIRPSKICTPYLVNATFPCEVSGYPQPKIIWYKNAKEIRNNNKTIRKGNSLIITSAWGKDEGIYQCIASNGLETIHQAASLIVGAQAPMIIESFKARNLSFYAKLDISCKLDTGKQQATLFWYRDGILIKESLDHRIHLKNYHNLWTLQIKNVTAADSGTYRCEAMNRAGSNFSEAKILVKGPAQVTFVPENVRGLLGKDVTITCKASGFPRAQITWYDKTGQPAPRCCRQDVVNKDGESILTIRGLETSDNGQYMCKARSGSGDPDSASVHLTVYGAPEEDYRLEVVEESDKKTHICENCIKWTKNGHVLKNSDRIKVKNVYGMCILVLDGILESDAGNYTCHKRTTTGVHKETIEIFVITRPRFIKPQSPNLTNVLEHGDVRMTCHGTGFPTPRTIWRRKIGGRFDEVKDSPRFHLTTNGSLTIVNAKADDETDYSCELRNSHSNGVDLTIKLNVNVPAKIVHWLTAGFGDAGNMTQLNCLGSGDEILNFTWFKNRQKIPRNSNIRIQLIPKLSRSTLTILSTHRKDEGNYTCKVFNSFGKDEKTMRLEVRDKPDPPILATQYKTKTSITISWTPSYNGNSPIFSYQIDYSIAARFSEPAVIHLPGQKTSYKITSLEPYTKYEIRVRATNALGMSGFSNVVHGETAEDVPSAAPNLTATPELSGNKRHSLRIKWTLLDVKDANGMLKGYNIWFKENSSDLSFKKETATPIDGRQKTLSKLKPYTYYKIKIQAFTSAGPGPNSSFIIKRTLEGVPSEPPGFVQVTGKTSTSILLSWKAPAKENINGVLIGYRVSYHNNRGPINRRSTVDTSSNQTSLALNGLGKYTKYTITIAARTLQGPGEKSRPINVITDEDIPGPPKDLSAVTTSVRSVKLTWSRPDEPNGKITKYKVYCVEKDNNDSTDIKHVEGTRITYEVEKLTENRTYVFWVCAKTSKGEGTCTNRVMASTSKGPPSFIDSQSGDVTARWKTTITLICRFSGFPIPTISWLDSKEKPINFGMITKYHETAQGHLVIHDLNRKDSKRYVCKVTNKWGTIKRGITLKVQAPPDPPKSIEFSGINSTAVKIEWIKGFDGNSVITWFILKYQRQIDSRWRELRLPGDWTEVILNNVESERKYSFMIKAINEIGAGNFSETKNMIFEEGAILKPTEDNDILNEMETTYSHKTIFKDSAVLGTLIGVCLFIILVIVVLALLTKLGYSPGSKLVQRSVEAWRWFVAKGISAKDHRRSRKRRSGGSSTDGHLGGSSSSLSQGPASNNGSTFSLPRSSSRVTESGYTTSVFPIPLPFGNYTPGPNGGVRTSGSSDEGIGPETRSDTRPGTGENNEYPQPPIPPRSSNGTPAPLTLVMSSREYIDPEGVEQDKMAEDMKENESEDVSPDISPRGKERIYFQSLGHCLPVPINMSPGRPKYEDGHFIIGPDVDHILAYRPPRCYDSTSSEYSSSRDELAQAYEFGKLHHLDDFYGRPTLESASSSGETASSEKDGICHFTSELSVGRPFLIPVAILPPPPNQRLRTRDRKRNPQGQPLNTYYEKDETLV